ncbi:MAG: iron ABC transporter permease [Rhodobacterales bacterium]|nr:MAG: iron ABC transporter permease [Rhodobacterales bacterium]
MTDIVPQRSVSIPRPSPWSIGAALIAVLVLLPIVAVIWLALFPTENIWPHLISTTLPRYLGNTIVLMFSVGAIAAAMGAGAAWLVVMYQFPGRRWLQWALLMPLAVPAYVGAYALVDFLEYAGPVQSLLRRAMGWQSARDYWFPEIRSMGAAVVVLSFALYPYVYILARAALREQSAAGYDVARALGTGPFGRLRRIALPLARPAIAAGAAVVMMETVNDFGVVDYYAVQTLTTGIFSVWYQTGNVGGAAQISGLVLAMVVFLVTMEKLGRRKARFFTTARGQRPITPQAVSGWRSWAIAALCALPVLGGFVLPVGVIGAQALNASEWVAPGLGRALMHTLVTGGLAALLTVSGALFMVYGVRLSGRRLPQLLMPVTAIGYAAPGAVLGLGLLIPLAAFDNQVADVVVSLGLNDPGLILTGSAAAVVLSYCVRFFGIAQGAVDGALGRISPSLPMAARSLGQNATQTLARVHVPMVRASVASTLLLVFIDCVKELPATLMLRPFGYNTLATRVHEKASLEDLAGAAPAALVICGVGLIAVTLLARKMR